MQAISRFFPTKHRANSVEHRANSVVTLFAGWLLGVWTVFGREEARNDPGDNLAPSPYAIQPTGVASPFLKSILEEPSTFSDGAPTAA